MRTLHSILALFIACFFNVCLTSTAFAKAHRIISLSPAASELIYELGIEKYLVGVDQYSNYPLAVKKLPVVGNLSHTNTEEIARLNPTLVISYYHANQDILRNLQGIIHFKQWNTSPEHIDQLLADAEHLASLVNADSTVYKKIDTWRTLWQTIKNHRPSSTPQTFFVFLGATPFYSVGNTSFLSQSLEACGVKNMFHAIHKSSMQVSIESLIANPPDIIIAGTDGKPDHATERIQTLLQEKGLRLKHTRIVVANNDILFRPSIRFLKYLPTLCEALNPSAFPPDNAE